MMGDSPEVKRNLEQNEDKSRSSNVMHAPIPTPPVDDMEPQSISFIGEYRLIIWLVF